MPRHEWVRSRSSNLMTTSEFIQKAQAIHWNKYDYSKVEYVNNKTKVYIICHEHGEFLQVPSSHLRGHGCLRLRYQMSESACVAKLFEMYQELTK